MIIKHGERTIRKACTGCGRKDLYWGHDTSVPNSTDPKARTCDKCRNEHGELSNVWVLIENDGERKHVCVKATNPATNQPYAPITDDAPRNPFTIEPASAAPKPDAVPAATVPTTVPDSALAAMQALLAALGPKVDRAEVEAIVKEAMADIVMPTRTVIQRVNGETTVIEGSHDRLRWIVKGLTARSHIMMVGPAGTGKSHLAEQAAEALGYGDRYGCISLSPTTPNSQILGYMDATGRYVESLYYKIYKDGGVFNFDEIDNSNPSTLAVINSGLSNGQMAFPCGMVKRHEEFRCVATANTYGRGADRQYVGRQQLDAATLDRFKVIEIPVDEALELQLCMATGLDHVRVSEVLAYVRKLRKSAERQKMLVMITPRASMGICRDLFVEDSAEDWTMAVEGWIFQGMTAGDRSKLGAY